MLGERVPVERDSGLIVHGTVGLLLVQQFAPSLPKAPEVISPTQTVFGAEQSQRRSARPSRKEAGFVLGEARYESKFFNHVGDFEVDRKFLAFRRRLKDVRREV